MERLGLTILLCTFGLGSASVPIHLLPVTNFVICCSLGNWILNIFLPSCFPRVFLNLNRSEELNDFFIVSQIFDQYWNKIIFFKVRKNLCNAGSGCCGTGFTSDFIIWNVLKYLLISFYNLHFFQQRLDEIFHRDAYFRQWNLHRYQNITWFSKRAMLFGSYLQEWTILMLMFMMFFSSVQEWTTTSTWSMTQETTVKRTGTTGTWSAG